MTSFRVESSVRWLATILAALTLDASPQREQPEARVKVRIGYSLSPPYMLVQGGKVTGLAVETMEEAARRKGLSVEWVEVPGGPDRALGENLTDIFPIVAILPERLERYYISERWIRTHYSLFTLKNGPAQDPGDLKGKRVTHLASAPARMLAKRTLPSSLLREVPTRPAVVQSVCEGTADAGFIEWRALTTILLERPEGCRDARFEVSTLHNAFVESGVGATKDRAAEADLLRAGIVAMARDGMMAQIFARWNVSAAADTSAIHELMQVEDSALRMRWLLASLSLMLVLTLTQNVRARRARRAAEAASIAKGEFLANMSHEIRTPLNGVVGLTAALAESPLQPHQRELVRDLSECSDSLLNVINDILDFSKIEAGMLTVGYAPFDLHEAVRTSMAPQAFGAGKKGLETSVTIDDDVPRWVDGDAVRLKQVLVNLIGNAVKFTNTGSVSVHVSRCAGGEVEFSVTDTGIGLDEASLSRLFQPFTQADSSTTRRFGGTGLGLAICKRITTLLGGSIGAESTLGQGSRFWFRIPVELANAPSEPAHGPTAEAVPGLPAPKHRLTASILVAEDNPVNRKVVERMLVRSGFAVDAAVNGAIALEAIKNGSYDLVLMDCQMPEMDGYRATEEIRKFERETNQPRIPIIAVTAHAMTGDREKCLDAGMDDYLTKPIQKPVLMEVLARWLPEASLESNPIENISHPATVPGPAMESSTHRS
jgi:signal transduction histidine kinase/CheY-like chemotaxis protein